MPSIVLQDHKQRIIEFDDDTKMYINIEGQRIVKNDAGEESITKIGTKYCSEQNFNASHFSMEQYK